MQGRDRDACFAAFLGNNRVGLILFLGLLMWYYRNDSMAAWIYLAMHGQDDSVREVTFAYTRVSADGREP